MENNRRIKKNRWIFTAGIILLLYGLVEIVTCATLLLMNWKAIENPYPSFVFQEMNDLMNNRPLYMFPVFVFLTYFRLMSAVGILRNRMWGFWMAIFVTSVNLAIMPLFLPLAGGDALAAIVIITCLFIGYLGKQPIAVGKSIAKEALSLKPSPE